MESQTIEWKREWKEEHLKEIAGFANSNGGILVIGIDDDGTVIGVKDLKDTMKRLSDTIANKLAMYPSIETSEEQKTISIIVPQSLIPIELNGKFYVRSGNAVHEVRGRSLTV